MGKKRGNQMKPLEDYSDIRGFAIQEDTGFRRNN